MNLSGAYIAGLHEQIKTNRPIIHCITNAVTVNDCANILLAAGASPTMAHHPLEVEEITEGTAALVCNMGAIDNYEAMEKAGLRASKLGHAIVVDPVGVSGSSYRRGKCLELIDAIHPTCIRGNYSEIRALLDHRSTMAGVDASPLDAGGAKQEDLMHAMQHYATEKKRILIASGATDIITDGNITCLCENGDPLMASITGSGCMSSVLLGAFLSVEKSLFSAVASCVFMGIAGELAAKKTSECNGGTMTFGNMLIDAISQMDEKPILDSVIKTQTI